MSNVNGGKWIRPERRLGIYLRDGFTCLYCGADLRGANPRQVTLDHVVPRHKGGSNDPTNLVTACLSCNSAKNGKKLHEFVDRVVVHRVRNCRRKKLNIALAKSLLKERSIS